jgi:hypothetical protein
MAYPHYYIIFRSGGYFQAVRESITLYGQRMITDGGKRRRQPVKHTPAVVKDKRGLTMFYFPGVVDDTAVGIADALVSQANAQDRQTFTESQDNVTGDTGVLRLSRSGRDDDSFRSHLFDFFQRDFVVPGNDDFLPQFA